LRDLHRFSLGLLVSWVALASAPALASPKFAPALTLATGSSPIRLTVADVNGDGRPDVMVPNRGSDSLSVFLGTAGALFGPPSSVPVATAPEAIAPGDFDGNGTVDLAVTTQTGVLHVLLGSGNGGFSEAAGSPMPIAPGSGNTSYGVAAGDVNGDGVLDVAATAHDAACVSVFLGDGRGGFRASPGSPFATGAGPMSVVMADFNADAHLDLAVSAEGTNDVTVLLGGGRGDFAQAAGSPFAAESGPTGLAFADFNEDGRLDLVCSHEASATALVFFGGGDGRFVRGPSLEAGVRTFGVTIGDFDVDGHTDIATADNGVNGSHVFRGDGAGKFTNAVGSPFAVGVGPAGIVSADVNLDGAPDLLFGNVGSGTMTVLLNETKVPARAKDAGVDAVPMVDAGADSAVIAVEPPDAFAPAVLPPSAESPAPPAKRSPASAPVPAAHADDGGCNLSLSDSSRPVAGAMILLAAISALLRRRR